MNFLNGDNLKKIWYPFYPRTTWHRSSSQSLKVSVTRKNIIPIGVQELVIKYVKDLKTKKGWRKVELHFYREPYQVYDYDTPRLGEKHANSSFDTIVVTHVKANVPMGKLSEEWYKSWTMCLGDKELDTMLKWEKKRFKAVIMHMQEAVKENGKPKVDVLGLPIVYWQPKIRSVHKLDEDVKIDDWFSLFKPIRYDPIAEATGLTRMMLYSTHVKDVTGGEQQDEAPF